MPRFLLLTGVYASLVSVSPCAQNSASNPANAETSFQRGVELLQQNRFEEARQELLRLTRRHPDSAPGFFYLGMAELRLGSVSDAEKSFRHALELDPGSSNTLYNLGVLLLEQKRPAEAVIYLKRANQIGPPSPEFSINLIRAYLEAGQNDGAFQLAEAAGLRFDTPAFHLALGKCFLSHGLAARARPYLEKADCEAPSQPEIVIPLANTYLQQRDPAAARKALDGIAASAQNAAEYHYLLAQCHVLSGQKRPALEEINLALRLEPRNPIYLLTLGRYYQKYGDQQKAVRVLEEAAKLAPDFAEIPYSTAVSYFIADDFEQASTFVDRALQIDPVFDRALFLLGIARFALGKLAEAERLLTRALELKPQNPYYQCFFGILLVSNNRLSEALGYFQRSLALDPSYALAHYQIGRVRVRLGQHEEARAELEKAATLQPNLPEAQYLLAQTYYKLGEKEKGDKALAVFKKYRAIEYTERQEMLKQVQEVVQGGP